MAKSPAQESDNSLFLPNFKPIFTQFLAVKWVKIRPKVGLNYLLKD